MHGTPGSSPAASGIRPVSSAETRLDRTQYAEAVRANAPLREQLSTQYPAAYRDLQAMTSRDLKGCLVTRLADGILKAVCQ